uniref:Uncharacterized protein n=1 Tax=Glossina austeni TaxID=7395 RepID=A0A1A9VCC3_GLOAU
MVLRTRSKNIVKLFYPYTLHDIRCGYTPTPTVIQCSFKLQVSYHTLQQSISGFCMKARHAHICIKYQSAAIESMLQASDKYLDCKLLYFACCAGVEDRPTKFTMRQESRRESVCKICQKIVIKKTTRRKERSLNCLNRTRTVRSITPFTESTVSKQVIGFKGVDQIPFDYSCWENKRNSISHGTDLDRIINKLVKDHHHADVMIMITPSSRHQNLYKLHAIERYSRVHLGMTSITQSELNNLKLSEAFRKYCIVFSSRYIDLKTVALESKTINNLVNALHRNCCCLHFSMDTNNCNGSQCTLKNRISTAGDCFKQGPKVLEATKSIMQSNPEAGDGTIAAEREILHLIHCINASAPTRGQDIERFFKLAEYLKFNIILRPELCWILSPIVNDDATNLTRFRLECFMPDKKYMGSICLDSEELLRKIDNNPGLLDKIQVIEDVFEITSLPPILIKLFRHLCVCLGLEVIYDIVGEYLFDRYKNVVSV